VYTDRPVATATSAVHRPCSSSSASALRDVSWIERHTPADLRAAVVDVSSAFAVYGVMGPRARDLLQGLTRADLCDEAFPFATSREIDLGPSTVRAIRITYVGELGWELYVPCEFAVDVYERLVGAGAVNAGYYTINSLRLDKGYRAFPADLTPDYTPVEAGLTFTCKLKTSIPFLGREAVEKAVADGARRRLVSFRIEDPDVMLWGGELVLRDDEAVGQVSSAAWSETLGSCVGLAYVWRRDREAVDAAYLGAGAYEVNVGGRAVGASVTLRPLFDPANLRIRG